MAMSVKKLLIDDKITASVKQIRLLGIIKFWKGKHCLTRNFPFLEMPLLSIFKFCASSNSLFSYELVIDPQSTFLECIVIFL